jgi:predicted metal-dependent peptidase
LWTTQEFKQYEEATMDTLQADRMSRARSRLLNKDAWYGAGSLKLDMHEDNSVKTAATDGKKMPYNAAYVATLSDPALITLVAHETGHPAFGHLWRFKDANHKLANMACDYWLNEQLENDGFEPIPDWLRDTQYDGKSVQEIYGILNRKEREEEDGNRPSDDPKGDNSDDMLPPDGDGDGDSESDEAGNDTDSENTTEQGWTVFSEEAKLVATKRGLMGAAAARAVEANKVPQADPWAVLKQFVTRHGDPTNYTWAKPNRRMLAVNGFYLPGMENPNMAPIIVVIDTSGSVTQELLNEFSAHISYIMAELRPQAIHVIYCDANVNGMQSFTPDDGPVHLKMIGGGGTAFQPAFDYIAAHPGEYADASCIVYLTDADGDNETLVDTVHLPTIWGIVPGWSRPLPFGETVKLY